MKRKTTKEILVESFYELSETKDINKITIRDITDNCGYSPATFYRQFRDKYDLIFWAYSEVVAGLMGKLGSGECTWKDTLLDAARMFERERDYLANLILHTGGHDAFIRYMTDINYDAFRDYILKVSGKTETDSKTDIYIRIYCMGTVSLTCEWILGKYDLEPEELADVYEKSLPEPLLVYMQDK